VLSRYKAFFVKNLSRDSGKNNKNIEDMLKFLLGIKRGHCDPEDKKVIEYNSVNKLK
jgi:hypothetical protein